MIRSSSPDGFSQTLWRASVATKNRLSHRARPLISSARGVAGVDPVLTAEGATLAHSPDQRILPKSRPSERPHPSADRRFRRRISS